MVNFYDFIAVVIWYFRFLFTFVTLFGLQALEAIAWQSQTAKLPYLSSRLQLLQSQLSGKLQYFLISVHLLEKWLYFVSPKTLLLF